jgi:hypothetical protein
MALVKHMAVNLLGRARVNTSLKNRRKLAGWNLAFLDPHSPNRITHSPDCPGGVTQRVSGLGGVAHVRAPTPLRRRP